MWAFSADLNVLDSFVREIKVAIFQVETGKLSGFVTAPRNHLKIGDWIQHFQLYFIVSYVARFAIDLHAESAPWKSYPSMKPNSSVASFPS